MTLVLAVGALLLGHRHLHRAVARQPRSARSAGRRRRPGAGQPARAAAAGRRARRAAGAGLGRSGGAARPARGCMCGWCCCSACVAVAPAILVAVLRRGLLQPRHPGLVQRPGADGAGGQSLQVAQAYLEEHRNNIRADALAMANDLTRAGELLLPTRRALRPGAGDPDALRGLTEAVVFDPRIRPGAGRSRPVPPDVELDPPPDWAIDRRAQRRGRGRCRTTGTRVRAVVQLDSRRRR